MRNHPRRRHGLCGFGRYVTIWRLIWRASRSPRAGVSERTLQYAFKRVMGMSPTTYLTRLRLHYACDELRRHHPRSTTVSKVAMRWGFWHWGDFARVYREYIGELPSETLRKN
jgi:AraC-like DNA-binding protein